MKFLRGHMYLDSLEKEFYKLYKGVNLDSHLRGMNTEEGANAPKVLEKSKGTFLCKYRSSNLEVGEEFIFYRDKKKYRVLMNTLLTEFSTGNICVHSFFMAEPVAS
jgi:hypothetical protein